MYSWSGHEVREATLTARRIIGADRNLSIQVPVFLPIHLSDHF
jgi:hypothetical protein